MPKKSNDKRPACPLLWFPGPKGESKAKTEAYDLINDGCGLCLCYHFSKILMSWQGLFPLSDVVTDTCCLLSVRVLFNPETEG